MTDLEKILERCKEHDRSAQADLYGWLAPKLLGLCLRYMQDRAEAEDVMQDAFVKIFSNIKAFKGNGSFEGWAKRIAVNTALTALKRKNRMHFERHADTHEHIGIPDEEPVVLNANEIMSCMAALPTGYRTIVNLFLVEAFSHKEIAEKLNITESTSRSQYARARQLLMKLIKEKTENMLTKNS